MLSCPTAVEVPVPTSGMANAGPETNTLPPVVPTDVGAKVSFNEIVCPGVIVIGIDGPTSENSLPVVCNADSVMSEDRVLVSTTDRVDFAPTATFPNEAAVGEAVTASLFAPVP